MYATHILEIYRNAVMDIAGQEPENLQLSPEVWAWLTEQGYGTDDEPDMWINLVEVGVWANNNRPVAELPVIVVGELATKA